MKLVVSLARLHAAADHMARFEHDVVEVLADVEEAMAALRPTWRGAASEAQMQAQLDWEQGAERMRSSLATLHAIARQAHTNYTGAVERNTKMWEV